MAFRPTKEQDVRQSPGIAKPLPAGGRSALALRPLNRLRQRVFSRGAGKSPSTRIDSECPRQFRPSHDV